MIIFTIINFWTDLKNFWNTGNKFGEGFVGRLDPTDTTVKSIGTPDESINPEECQAVSHFDSYYGYPFSKINEAGNPKGCFIQHGNAPGAKGVYYNENTSSTANCGAFNVSLCVEKIKKPPITITSGKGGVTGISLTAAECKGYADDNNYGYGINNNNPKGCIKTGNQVRFSTGDNMECSTTNSCIENPNPYLRVTSGKGGVTGKSLTADECKQYANYNKYGYGINNNNPKGCIKTGNQVRFSTGDNMECSTTNSCIEKYRTPIITPEAAAYGVAGVKGAKIQLAIDGAWNSDINKEFECKPGTHSVDESPAYNDSCDPRDKCKVQINEKCEARIGMWDRCVKKNSGAGDDASLGWSKWITAGQSTSNTNSCKIKQIMYKQTPEAAAMTAESPSNETPVVNNIQAPPPPEWHDSKLAKQFKLPNGHLVRPGEGVCPNACKIPHYDQKNCANEILDGKEYRTCPWVKDGTSDMDCKSCGAVLIPKNEYGFARTNPALLDVNHVNDVMKITNVEGSKDNKYNMGKNFMKQLSFIRHFALPDSITTNEYVTIGKLVNAHQKYPKSHKIETILTKFINTILRTNSLSENGKNIRANELISAQVNSQGGNFDVDEKKLSGEGALAYKQGLEEAASNNRLGGSKTLYREMTEDSGYTKQYHPRDPRRKPSPYNSIWNIFNY